MKLVKLALPVLACTGIALMAQDNGPIEEWMKTTNASVQALRKMEKKTGPEAVAHAEKISAAYENMVGFWKQRNADDAVKLSEDGKAAAVQLAAAAKAENVEEAGAAFGKVGGTCMPCHAAHRVRSPEGKYSIK
jgi:cytochrome c556